MGGVGKWGTQSHVLYLSDAFDIGARAPESDGPFSLFGPCWKSDCSGDPISVSQSVSQFSSVQLFLALGADADRGPSRLGFGVSMARMHSKCEYEFDEHATSDAPHFKWW